MQNMALNFEILSIICLAFFMRFVIYIYIYILETSYRPMNKISSSVYTAFS